VNGAIYFGSDDGNLYAVDIHGKGKWKYKTEGWVESSPVIDDGRIYFGSSDGYLYSLQ
jgi:outer membrane protein assembly factor BamB